MSESNKVDYSKGISIIYDAELPDIELEKELEALLKKYGYIQQGAGFGFGKRDIDYAKKSEEK